MANPDLWPVHSFADGLVSGGVRDVVISPGSRNTPLTVAFVEHPDIRVYSHMDERSAAFFALGLARASHRPVAMACTSGTAAANYYPAVMEAFEARVPLIVLTADRPPLLRDVGANQAVRQTGVYAAHVKWSVEMPVPDGQQKTAAHAATVAARACATASAAPAGPVHINYPFVEPLMPERRSDVATLDAVTVPAIHLSETVANGSVLDLLTRTFAASQRPLIVVGPHDDLAQLDAIWTFALANQIPLLVDPLGQLRSRASKHPDVMISHYDTLLKANADQLRELHPDWILRFGAQPTSKALSSFLGALAGDARIILVDDGPIYRDASFCATDVVIGDISNWLTSTSRTPLPEQDTYRRDWSRANQLVRDIVHRQVDVEWSEASLIYHLSTWLDAGHQLLIGNSRPVRDLDTVFEGCKEDVCIFANRGTSGIDGVVSTAFGLAASHPEKHTVLCIGDVSFYHDLNGLLAARRFAIPLTIVLVHNHGGGIFQHLSQAQRSDILPYFTTPHDIDFQPIVEAYGGRFTRATSIESCFSAFQEASRQPSLNVIEVAFENETSALWHRRLLDDVRIGMVSRT